MAGGATEVGNAQGTAGTVLNEDSTVARNAKISIVPADFNPLRQKLPDSLETFSDNAGNFKFDLVPVNKYRILCESSSGLLRSITDTFSISENTKTILTKPISETGTIKIPDVAQYLSSGTGIFIPGTIFYTTVSELDNHGFIINCPKGRFSLFSDNGLSTQMIKDTFSVTAGDTVLISIQ